MTVLLEERAESLQVLLRSACPDVLWGVVSVTPELPSGAVTRVMVQSDRTMFTSPVNDRLSSAVNFGLLASGEIFSITESSEEPCLLRVDSEYDKFDINSTEDEDVDLVRAMDDKQIFLLAVLSPEGVDFRLQDTEFLEVFVTATAPDTSKAGAFSSSIS